MLSLDMPCLYQAAEHRFRIRLQNLPPKLSARSGKETSSSSRAAVWCLLVRHTRDKADLNDFITLRTLEAEGKEASQAADGREHKVNGPLH